MAGCRLVRRRFLVLQPRAYSSPLQRLCSARRHGWCRYILPAAAHSQPQPPHLTVLSARAAVEVGGARSHPQRYCTGEGTSGRVGGSGCASGCAACAWRRDIAAAATPCSSACPSAAPHPPNTPSTKPGGARSCDRDTGAVAPHVSLNPTFRGHDRHAPARRAQQQRGHVARVGGAQQRRQRDARGGAQCGGRWRAEERAHEQRASVHLRWCAVSRPPLAHFAVMVRHAQNTCRVRTRERTLRWFPQTQLWPRQSALPNAWWAASAESSPICSACRPSTGCMHRTTTRTPVN